MKVHFINTIKSYPIGTVFLFRYVIHPIEIELVKIEKDRFAYRYIGQGYTKDFWCTSNFVQNEQRNFQFYLLDVIGKALEFDEDMEKLLE